MVGWAVYTVCLRWRPRELSSSAFTGSLIAIGVAVLLPVFAWDYGAGRAHAVGTRRRGPPSPISRSFRRCSRISSGTPAVARVGGERAGTFLHLMPLFGAVLAWIFLGESLLWYHYVGAVLIFSGLFIASRAARREASAAALP